MNPRMRRTGHPLTLTSQHCLQRIDCDIIQEEEKRLRNMDPGRLGFPSALLALSLISITIMLLHLLLPRALNMREQWLKCSVSPTRHGQQKLGTLFDLLVGKHHLLRLEEENSVLHRVLHKRITLR